MYTPNRLNFIVTCHNSEALIARVLDGVLRSSYQDSAIICVLDGCTDATDERIDAWQLLNDRDVTKLYTPDVHELLSINAGLADADHRQAYNIILQDDVILDQPDLGHQISKLYRRIPNLGYVSFRLGFNLASHKLTPSGYIEQIDEIESAYGAGVCGDMLLPGRFAYRSVPIKSPVCLPGWIYNQIGGFNRELAPYGYDDADLAIRSVLDGHVNGVYGIRFESDVRWGGTRRSGHPDIQPAVRRNAKLIMDRYCDDVRRICLTGQRDDIVRIMDVTIEGDRAAEDAWRRSQQVLKELNP